MSGVQQRARQGKAEGISKPNKAALYTSEPCGVQRLPSKALEKHPTNAYGGSRRFLVAGVCGHASNLVCCAVQDSTSSRLLPSSNQRFASQSSYAKLHKVLPQIPRLNSILRQHERQRRNLVFLPKHNRR
jgi:hypothetical protein